MVIVVTYNWWYGDLLHTADTCYGCLRTAGDHLFSLAGLWVHQLGVYVWSSVFLFIHLSGVCPLVLHLEQYGFLGQLR